MVLVAFVDGTVIATATVVVVVIVSVVVTLGSFSVVDSDMSMEPSIVGVVGRTTQTENDKQNGRALQNQRLVLSYVDW